MGFQSIQDRVDFENAYYCKQCAQLGVYDMFMLF